MSEARCYRHPETPAHEPCAVCHRAICSSCALVAVDGAICPPCMSTRKRRSWLRKGSLALLLVAAGAYVVQQWRHYEPPFDHGDYGFQIDKLSEKLEREPCDRTKIIELADLLNRAGDYRATLKRAQRFFAACGEHPRLLWNTYAAYKNLSEFKKAAAEASKLIAADPDDQDYYWWRGQALRQQGDLKGAARDFAQCMLLLPRATACPTDLADVYEQQGRFCEAIAPLDQFLFFHPDQRSQAKFKQRLNRLNSKGACNSKHAQGRAQIRFLPSSGAIRTTARFNDRIEGTFLIDTGASFVTVSREFADRLGLAYKDGPKVRLHSASGVHSARLSTATRIQVQGLSAQGVVVAVMDGLLAQSSDAGLLGLSFLSRFALTVDAERGLLILDAAGQPGLARQKPRRPPRHHRTKSRREPQDSRLRHMLDRAAQQQMQ